MLSNAERGRAGAPGLFFGVGDGRKHAAMSTSPANSDDRLGHVAPSVGCATEGGLLSALSSVPDFTFPDAARCPMGRKGSDEAEPAPTSPLERADDGDVKRSQTTIRIPPDRRQIHGPPGGKKLPSQPLIPGKAAQSPGYFDLDMPTPLLRRPGFSLAGVRRFLVASTIAAMFAGCLVVAILELTEDSALPVPSLRQAPILTPPSPPQAAPALNELGGVMVGSGPEREIQTVSRQPTVSPQPSVSLAPIEQLETQATEGRSEVTLPPTVAQSQFEEAAGKTAAMESPRLIATPESAPAARPDPAPVAAPERGSIATPEATPLTKPEPRLEPPGFNQAPPHAARTVAADRAGFLFANSNVRYLTRGELEQLSADRLHIARNEIFARRGRYFKDDALRAYFSQFPWYQPRAWGVPLNLVERTNVGLIQSIETSPAAATRSVMGPLPGDTTAKNGVVFADPSRRYLTHEDLQGLSAEQLAIVRNEIYARRGRYFKDDALRAYFSEFPWYQPHGWEVQLSPVEEANVRLVRSFEAAAMLRQPSKAWRGPPM